MPQSRRLSRPGLATKDSVRSEGWYRVSQADLIAGGLDPKPTRDCYSSTPRAADSNRRRTDKEGHLSAVGFYGVGVDAAYTDARAYWLISGTQRGLRIAQVKGGVTQPPPEAFSYAVERKDRTITSRRCETAERDNFFRRGRRKRASQPSLALLACGSISNQAKLEVALQGVTSLAHECGLLE